MLLGTPPAERACAADFMSARRAWLGSSIAATREALPGGARPAPEPSTLAEEAARDADACRRRLVSDSWAARYSANSIGAASGVGMIVADLMVQEVREGRGAGPEGDYVYLDLTHLPAEQIETKLPDITEFARTYLGVDPVTELDGGSRARQVTVETTDGTHSIVAVVDHYDDTKAGGLLLSVYETGTDTVVIRTSDSWKALGYPTTLPGLTSGAIDIALFDESMRGELARRVDDEAELTGLDQAEHAETAYNLASSGFHMDRVH